MLSWELRRCFSLDACAGRTVVGLEGGAEVPELSPEGGAEEEP